MRQRQAGGDDFIAHPAWEWDVYQLIAVDVPELPLSEAVFRPPKAVRMGADTLNFDTPLLSDLFDTFAGIATALYYPQHLIECRFHG